MSGDQPTWLNLARNRAGGSASGGSGYQRFGRTTQVPPNSINNNNIGGGGGDGDDKRDTHKHVKNVWLHLGGAPQLDQTVGLFNDLPAGQGFTGCLHSLRINGRTKEIFR